MVGLNLDIFSKHFSCSFIQRLVSTLGLFFRISEIFRSWYSKEFGWMGVAMQCALSMIFLTQFTRMVRNEFFFSFWKFKIAICKSIYCRIPIDCISQI